MMRFLQTAYFLDLAAFSGDGVDVFLQTSWLDRPLTVVVLWPRSPVVRDSGFADSFFSFEVDDFGSCSVDWAPFWVPLL